MAAPKLDATTGSGAVALSKEARKMKDEVSLARDDDAKASPTLRRIGTKTFYLENGVWIDSEYDATSKLPETQLKFASDAYFDVAMRDAELAKFLAVGDQVVLVWKGKLYRISK
jgi:hypothetical protein